ncbi:hypothetical protein CHS0354_019832 [Potamilus streckersoni]|uniref:DBB domain-containing protein n=1 Tax=Potamilus streckersoni TaxID=2493646 RepID=A0AAE0SYD1_9BIVA|nr:hypothetical protein CHS0354_019832 [Potamilus streckersoni]
MSKQIVHSIFYQPDGESFAFDIEDFFSSRFNLQFQLNDLETVNSKSVSNLGVSILLLTPETYECIRCGKHSDLRELFPNPDFSIAILYFIDKSHHEITQMLAPQTRNFKIWTILEYQSHKQFNSLCKDIMALVVTLEGQTFQTTPLQSVRVWPRKGVKANQQLMLIFSKPIHEEADVSVIQTWDNVKKETKRFSAVNYSFTIGDVEAGHRNLVVFVNDAIYGKAVLHVLQDEPEMEQIAKLVHDVINPLELLCQVLRLDSSSREDLDRELIDLMPDNIGPSSIVRYGEHSSKHEIPTLVHFGAKFGLHHFCMQLLRLPGGKQTLQIKNKNGLLPHEIADEAKFKDLAFALQSADEKGKEIPFGRKSAYDEKRYSDVSVQRRLHEPDDGQRSRYNMKKDSGISGMSSGISGMNFRISEAGMAQSSTVHRRCKSPSNRISSGISWNRQHHYEEIESPRTSWNIPNPN